MKRLFRTFLIEILTLYFTSRLAYGIVFERGFETLFSAAIALTVSFLIVRPIINLLLLPINLITFNLFRWVSSAVALYIVTLIVPGFHIVSFVFTGAKTPLIDLPPLSFEGVMAFVAFSLIISVATGIINWIIQ